MSVSTASEVVARRYVDLLERGVAVVTPNKRANTMEQAYYDRLQRTAAHRGVPFLYEFLNRYETNLFNRVEESLAFLAPFLNLWLGYRCLACPSGYAPHKKMDGPGIVLACLYWLSVLAGVSILVFVIAQSAGLLEQWIQPPDKP